MWAVATARTVECGDLDGDWTPKIAFVVDERIGVHASNVAAKRAFCLWWDASTPADMSDDWVNRQFRAYSQNQGLAKIVKVEGQ